MSQKTVTVAMENPIERGEQKIESLSLRKPVSGELRGIRLSDLLNSDVGTILTVLPRISSPTLTPQECAELDPIDLAAISGEIIGFFMNKAQREHAARSS